MNKSQNNQRYCIKELFEKRHPAELPSASDIYNSYVRCRCRRRLHKNCSMSQVTRTLPTGKIKTELRYFFF